MKKLHLDPLDLDKETIAKLDEKQLAEIIGGLNTDIESLASCSNGGSCTPGSSCTAGSSC
jgi:bacteriocin-like protein